MYAIIDICGQQEKVEKGKDICINRIEKPEGTEIKNTNVLFCMKDKGYVVGTPYVKGASVALEIVSHTRGVKVFAFKYKRRKGYHRKVGHRQDLTVLKVKEITV